MRFHVPPGRRGAVAVLDLPGDPGTRVYVGGLGSASTVAFAGVVQHPSVVGRHRSLVVDLPGSGWSDHEDETLSTVEDHADALASVVRSFVDGPVELVGHSLGGSVAISLAHRHRDLVHRLVVCEPNLDPGVGTFSASIAAWSESDFVACGQGDVVERLRRVGTEDAGAAEFARTVARWSPTVLHRTAVSLLADRTPTFREQLVGLELPRVLVMGEETRSDEPDVLASGCEVVVVPDAGHVVMADNLDGFCAALH